MNCALADAVSVRIAAVQSSKRVMFWFLVVGLIADHATVDGRRVRLLVALARCGDLLLCAKHLFVAATSRRLVCPAAGHWGTRGRVISDAKKAPPKRGSRVTKGGWVFPPSLFETNSHAPSSRYPTLGRPPARYFGPEVTRIGGRPQNRFNGFPGASQHLPWGSGPCGKAPSLLADSCAGRSTCSCIQNSDFAAASAASINGLG
jgi:hypothetical protein